MTEDPLTDYRKRLKVLARVLDESINGDQRPRQNAFVLLIAPFGEAGRVNYISNADRKDIIDMMKEFIARQEGLQ